MFREYPIHVRPFMWQILTVWSEPSNRVIASLRDTTGRLDVEPPA